MSTEHEPLPSKVEQLFCYIGSSTEALMYDVEGGTLRLINDERFHVGKLQADGSINWFNYDTYVLTWRRNRNAKGKSKLIHFQNLIYLNNH